MAQQPAETQPRQAGDLRDHLRRARRVRIDAAAMEADVHLDQDVDLAAGRAHRLRPSARDVEVVDDEREARAVEQREHAVGVDGLADRAAGCRRCPASANTSASPSFAQQMPTAPRSICSARESATCASWRAAAAAARRRRPPPASGRCCARRAAGRRARRACGGRESAMCTPRVCGTVAVTFRCRAADRSVHRRRRLHQIARYADRSVR